MNSNENIVFIILLLSFISSSFSQTKTCGEENHRKAIDLYYQKNYDEALLEIEKAIICDSYYFYYDAACIAAKSGNKEKAILYLQNSIKLGWANMNHLKNDGDLETLKAENKWLELDSLKEETLSGIKKEINKLLKQCPSNNLIPYQQNGKWGYINETDKTKVTDAIFDKVSFINPKAKIVYGQYYFDFTCNRGIIKTLEDPIFSEEIFEDRYVVDSTITNGFLVEDKANGVTNYKYSAIYKKFKGAKIKDGAIGIMEDDNGFSIINEKGEIINDIQNLSKIIFHNYGDDTRFSYYPPNKDEYGDFILFFIDKENNLGFIDNTFKTELLTKKGDLKLPYLFWSKDSINLWRVSEYIFIKEKEKFGVWSCLSKSWIFKPKFDKINSVDTYSSSDPNNVKKYNTYFQVEVNQKTFYINISGEKLLPKT